VDECASVEGWQRRWWQAWFTCLLPLLRVDIAGGLFGSTTSQESADEIDPETVVDRSTVPSP